MGTATRFWNWMAERYARQAIADEASYEKKLAITQRHLEPGMSVVEFGCGTGSTAVIHAPKVKSYHAIDVAEKMVEIGRSKATDAGLSTLHFSVGTLESVGLPDASCDAVLGLNILHLVPDLAQTIETVARVLVPGGYFFSSTICLKDGPIAMRLLAGVMRFVPFVPTLGSFSAQALEEQLERAGLAIEERFEQRPGVVFLVAVKR